MIAPDRGGRGRSAAMEPGPLLILSGPSGAGKTTLVSRLIAEQRWPMSQSVSVTTRRPRPGELPDQHYHFWNVERFLEARGHNAFLEWAEVFGNYYGTLAEEAAQRRARGAGCWLVIDVQGWQQVCRRCPEAVSIFVMTSSLEEYERRLRRRTESDESMRRRLETARAELAYADQYDYRVINDDLETALAELRQIMAPLFRGERPSKV